MTEAEGSDGVRARPANILVIVTDDLGHNDVSFYGNKLVRTPNIDAIAAEGAVFLDSYAGDAVCAPSRAALLTGRNPQRYGFEYLPFSPGAMPDLDAMTEDKRAAYLLKVRERVVANGLSLDEITLAEFLKGQGYRTALFGKWHLGESEDTHPMRRGFDEFVGVMGGAALHAAADDPDIVSFHLPWSRNDAALWRVLKHQIVRGTGRPEPADGYLSDVVAGEASDFVARTREQPFFLYVAFQEPHMPLQAPRAFYDRLDHVTDEKTRVYYAMVEALDAAVGRILAALETAGAARDTLVVFTSDNGGSPWPRIPQLNLPYRGWKFTYFEGGLNVPFFVRWSGRIAPGTVVPGVASQLDIYPTAAAIAGAALPEDRDFDGIDLMPILIGGDASPLRARELVWRKGEYWCLRRGDHKLQVSFHPAKTWLFDLKNDPTERINLADARPDVVGSMRAALDKRLEAFVAPAWPPAHRARIDIDGTPDADGVDREYIEWSD